MGTVIVIILVVLSSVLLILMGNVALISGEMEGFEGASVFAVIADIVLVIWLLSVIGKRIYSSCKKNCEKNRAESTESVVEEIDKKISHRNEIQQTFDRYFGEMERVFSLVDLISSCMGDNNQELNNLLLKNKEEAFADTKNEILSKLSESEKKGFPKSVDEVENYEKTLEREISELKTDLTSVATCDDEQLSKMTKKYCPEMYKSIKRKRLKLIAKIVILTTIIITVICSFNFIKNAPYREMQLMIEEQSLTDEMLSWEGSYYDYIQSKKGCRFLVLELTKLHRANDIKKAMWLLCIQPGCIDGKDACASDSFMDWVVDYARENGSQNTDSKGNITYSVDGYEVTINPIFDYSSGDYFRISNSQYGSSVVCKNRYHEENIPTIQ